MKKISVLLVLLSLVFAMDVFAGGRAGDKKSGWDLDGKFYTMSGMIVKNAEELGLSEQQKEAVKEKKYALKKALVQSKAEIDLVCIDISKELWKDKIDVNAVNALVDKKYQLKADKTKAVIGAYGDLKNSLTAGQKETMKELCDRESGKWCKTCCKVDMSKSGKKR
jgi:Spy/CpxP family protein refolding chaperone